jgi:hypothetical protein
MYTRGIYGGALIYKCMINASVKQIQYVISWIASDVMSESILFVMLI